jgi:hypothetical protein
MSHFNPPFFFSNLKIPASVSSFCLFTSFYKKIGPKKSEISKKRQKPSAALILRILNKSNQIKTFVKGNLYLAQPGESKELIWRGFRQGVDRPFL